MLEFGQEKRHGFIAIPEGLKGEGWRRFVESLREAVLFSSFSGINNRVPDKLVFASHVSAGQKGSFAEVLKKLLPSMEGRREANWVAGGKVVQLVLQSQ